MAADTCKFPARPPQFLRSRIGVPGHRVPNFDVYIVLMTTKAEHVDRFSELVSFITGMRIMTNYTSRTPDNSVQSEAGIFPVHQISFIAVTGDTDIQGPIGPEKITVLISMGVMAQDAARDHGTMAMFFGFQFFLAIMTDETGIVDFARGYPYSPRLGGLQVTNETLIIDHGAMLPFDPGNKVFVADGAGRLSLQLPHWIDARTLMQIMTVLATIGQLVVQMEKVDIFLKEGLTLYRPLDLPIIELDQLVAWNNGKLVFPRHQRQPEMQVAKVPILHNHFRFK